jgi:ATP/maltotriose-dependent transcriptional regulator MalT
VAAWQGDYSAAHSLLDESVSLARKLGDQQRLANALAFQGLAASFQGDRVLAHRLIEESLTLARGLGKMVTAMTLVIQGYLASWQSDFEQAHSVIDECLTIARELSVHHMICWCLNNRGRVAALQGDYEVARRSHQESLTIAAATGEKQNIVDALEGFARVALHGVRAPELAARAARLLGAAEALREASELPVAPTAREEYDRTVQTACARLGEAAFAAAWGEGRRMTLEQVLADARQEFRTD